MIYIADVELFQHRKQVSYADHVFIVKAAINLCMGIFIFSLFPNSSRASRKKKKLKNVADVEKLDTEGGS